MFIHTFCLYMGGVESVKVQKCKKYRVDMDCQCNYFSGFRILFIILLVFSFERRHEHVHTL